MRPAGERPWTGRTALFLMLGFFGVVFAANGVFVYLATSSWTGLYTDDAYRKGLDYNQTIERAAAQQALGWRTSVSLDAVDQSTHRLTVLLNDRTERPLDNREVTATLRGTVSAGDDIAVPLNWTGSGHYSADVALPARGQWDVRVEVVRDSDVPYLIETRRWSVQP